MTEKRPTTQKVFHVPGGLTNMSSSDYQEKSDRAISGIQGKVEKPKCPNWESCNITLNHCGKFLCTLSSLLLLPELFPH